jgi:hypothetical protein
MRHYTATDGVTAESTLLSGPGNNMLHGADDDIHQLELQQQQQRVVEELRLKHKGLLKVADLAVLSLAYADAAAHIECSLLKSSVAATGAHTADEHAKALLTLGRLCREASDHLTDMAKLHTESSLTTMATGHLFEHSSREACQ